MMPWQAQYWQEVVAWGAKAKAMFSGADNLPVALCLNGAGVVWRRGQKPSEGQSESMNTIDSSN